MVSGFARHPDGTVQRLSSVEQAVEAAKREDLAVWIDLEAPPEADLHAVGEVLQLDRAALEDCLYGEQRPRIDEFEDYIFLVLYGMLDPEEGDAANPHKSAAFCGTRFLVTVHREAVRSITVVRNRGERHVTHLLARGVDYVLHYIIDGMVDTYLNLGEAHENAIEALEEASLAEDVDESVLTRSVSTRRQLIELRQLAVSLRELLAPVAKGEFDYVSESLEPRFSHVHDHLTKAIEQIDGLRERLNAIRENYHTALTRRTNEIMRTLTAFATVLLPLSLIAGIYGMNLSLWPSSKSPLAFWGVLLTMLVVAIALMLYFRRRYWI